jgi:hypothetical protein
MIIYHKKYGLLPTIEKYIDSKVDKSLLPEEKGEFVLREIRHEVQLQLEG